ncbi:MAG: Gfo/Idh/MocA family oxidoreductase, partial [Thermoplasmata archaeon]|nr:Gfo/Idh/MocA family oxidoreductase [Thermoplasmata archaeon]
MGIDIDDEKVELARKLGADLAINSRKTDMDVTSENFTKGFGFDAVIITAATSSNQPVVDAGRIACEIPRVIVVGGVGLEIPRTDYYNKEIEFIISRSYGPGRYDREYELEGRDYPFGYVRWTEKRNMGSFIELIMQGKVDLSDITTHEFLLKDAEKAYAMVNGDVKDRYIGILFDYRVNRKKKPAIKRDVYLSKGKKGKGKNIVGVIGSGSIATTSLLPPLGSMGNVRMKGVASLSGTSAKAVGKKYGYEYSTSDPGKILEDEDINKVLIFTRNSTHFKFARDALENGKDVFVEKPVCLSLQELKQLEKLSRKHKDKLFYVDYNRRYSPWTDIIVKEFNNRTSPLIVNYRINGDPLPGDHWVYDKAEGSSRYISELCHFVDYIHFLVNSPILDVNVYRMETSNSKIVGSENIVFTMKFKDGSLGNITYSTVGNTSLNKEFIEVMGEGKSIVLKDFSYMEIIKGSRRRIKRSYLGSDKGHKAIITNFINGVVPEPDMLTSYRYILKAAREL